MLNRAIAAVVAAVAISGPAAAFDVVSAADGLQPMLAAERVALAALGADRETVHAAAAMRPLPAADVDLAALNDHDALTNALARDAATANVAVSLVGDAAGVVDLEHVDSMPYERGGPQWRCLTKAIYFESRGQIIEGQVAVAEVILNRVDDRNYPDSICGVVRQGEEKRNRCQFSFMCDGKPEDVHEMAAWRRAGKIATMMMEGRPRTITGSATHFHTTYVSPGWARRLERIVRVDDHIFYRYPTRIASN